MSSSSNEGLQQYVGKSLKSVQETLENEGYEVHLVRLGSCATGCVPVRNLVYGEEPPKSVVISFNGDDPEQKVQSIKHRH